MEDIPFTEARNGLKLPTAAIEAEPLPHARQDGTYLARRFFSDLWVLNNANDNLEQPLHEFVIPNTDDTPLIVFRSQYQARQEQDIEQDIRRQQTFRDYNRMPVRTATHYQSIFVSPEVDSTSWKHLLTHQHASFQGVGSTSSYHEPRDSIVAPAIEEAKVSWQGLSFDAWVFEHKKAVRNLLLHVVEMAK